MGYLQSSGETGEAAGCLLAVLDVVRRQVQKEFSSDLDALEGEIQDVLNYFRSFRLPCVLIPKRCMY